MSCLAHCPSTADEVLHHDGAAGGAQSSVDAVPKLMALDLEDKEDKGATVVLVHPGIVLPGCAPWRS